MSTTTETATKHPAWCDQSRCENELGHRGEVIAVYHASEPRTWAWDSEDGQLTAELELNSIDSYAPDDPGAPVTVSVSIRHGDSNHSVEAVEALGAWLTARAAEYRAAVS